MTTIDSTLIHHVVPPASPSSGPHPALLLLHGRGADEEDLLGLAEFLDDRLFLMSVRAPFPFGMGGGYTWYDAGTLGEPDPAMFRTSYDALSTFVDDALKGYPIDSRRFFLLGFSMGTVMSYALALTRPSLVRGVVANSGYLPEGTHLSFQWTDLANTDFFIAHGTEDTVIPVALARRARLLFDQAGARYTYREYPMAHQISEESLADSVAWLAERLNSREGA